MAIKGQFTTLSGLELQEAYANIPRVEVLKQKVEDANVFKAGGYVTVYANETVFGDGKQPIEGKSVSVTLSAECTALIMEAVYSALKRENIIENAEDC